MVKNIEQSSVGLKKNDESELPMGLDVEETVDHSSVMSTECLQIRASSSCE